MKRAGCPLPAGAVAISRWNDLAFTGRTFELLTSVDLTVTRNGLPRMAADYLGGGDPRNPLASPIFGDFSGLPPLLVIVGGHEGLLDDAINLARQAALGGVDVTLRIWAGMQHVFPLYAGFLPEADAAIAMRGAGWRASWTATGPMRASDRDRGRKEGNHDQRYDAIIIGAGIIGACTAFELAKRGWRTLNLDKLPAAGYGSTGSSCAIIRTHYSTLDGAALAWEGFFAWDDWAGYLGVADERGLARFHKTGCLVMKTEANDHLQPICRHMDALGIPWEDWGPERIDARLPFYDLAVFGPPKQPTIRTSRCPGRGAAWRRVLPLRRLCRRPAARQPQRPARRRGRRGRCSASTARWWRSARKVAVLPA